MKLIVALLLALPLFVQSLSAEERLELVRHSLTGTHCRYREYINDIPSDQFTVRPCPTTMLRSQAQTQLPIDTPLRIINGRVARREIVADNPLEPWAHDYDVETGALIRSEPLFYRAAWTRVFQPNPVVALNDPTLQDRNDSADAVPEGAYTPVELNGVAASGPLSGPYVKIVDRQSPNIPPIDVASIVPFNREDDAFEDVNVYFHIDRMQQVLQSFGYVGARAIAPYAIEADVHSAGGSDNSFFLPSPLRAGEGTLHFGDGGTDDAEDADIVVHEYGHAIQEWISPGTFGGAFTSEARAMSEGFGDYLAFSAHNIYRRIRGRDRFCFADWDARCWEDEGSQQCGYRAGSDCLRRLDDPRTMADYERTGGAGTEHRNGMIWSSVLREIRDTIGGDTDAIVLEAMFDVPPQPTFAVMAERMLAADRLLFNGAYGAAICASMSARGILPSCEATLPRGERTLFQSGDHALTIPDAISSGITSTLTITDPRAIEKIYVRVDIVHPSRGDLRIELVAPDDTVVLLQPVSVERGADVRATYGLTAQPAEPLDVLRGRSAAGVWKLIVRDQRTRDIGTLRSWGLVLQLAGDAPLSDRPRGEIAQMIPVVTHVFGIGATPFASDVRIANPSDERVTATLIFTRSGHDGRTDFGAIDAVLEAGQTIAFDDVVDSAFHTAGSGTLEVLGDVVVMSRTYATTAIGTVGQQVPPGLETTAISEAPLVIVPLPLTDTRYNLGIAETAGAAGIVRAGDREIEILPFSHTQFPVASDVSEIEVIEGGARVSAYVSQVDNASGDAMLVPAQRPQTPGVIAPAIRTGTWRSELWVPDEVIDDFGTEASLIGIRVDSGGNVAHTRVRAGGMSQYIPLLTPDGGSEQHLVFVESVYPYRTNIGIVTDASSTAEVIVYDAAGNELAAHTLITDRAVAQLAVTVPVTAGRARVRFLSGTGRAYASLVDGRTGDATYIVYSSPRNDRRIATAGASRGAVAGAASAQAPRRSDPATARHAQ